MQCLQKWADPNELCVASYFLWNSGELMEKSQKGLFQALLYQILRQEPGLIRGVCPERRDHESWSIKELRETLRRVGGQACCRTRFCFFIDGLNEYEGDEEEVVSMLQFLTISSHVKICASTRPRAIFSELFRAEHRTLFIHNHTMKDMEIYVRRRLARNSKFQALGANENGIVRMISRRAEGVWLWAFFVTRMLIRAIARDEGLKMMMRILEEFLSNLESYFRAMLDDIDPRYRRETAQMLLFATDAGRPLPLLAYFAFEQENIDPGWTLRAAINPQRRECRINGTKETELVKSLKPCWTRVQS
jgi:hypothetical protein